MAKSKTPMTPSDASRIQSHADRNGTNQSFKARAQRGASTTTAGGGKGGGKGKGK
jgi:hypothetical protein